MTLRNNIVPSILTLVGFLFASCGILTKASRNGDSDYQAPAVNSAGDPSAADADIKRSDDKKDIPKDKEEDNDPRIYVGLRVRNFDQYYQTLASVTGVDPKTQSLVDEFNKVKNQLLASNDVNSMTAFSQLAMLNLANRYCALAMVAGNPLTSAVLTNETFVDAMVAKYLDSPLASYAGADDVKKALLELMAPTSGLYQAPNLLKQRAVACSAFLASAYFFIY